MRKIIVLLTTIAVVLFSTALLAQTPKIKVVRFTETDELLNNPHKGFMTFQRFNGDTLNAGMRWTEGKPIEYQDFDGDLTNPNHPPTRIAYFRVNWRYVEPEDGKYNWPMLDKALDTAASRGQTLILRVSPYQGGIDVPDWYRKIVGKEDNLPIKKWSTDPENPLFAKRFGAMIKAIAHRYDGNPYLEAVDMAIVGYWGEGAGAKLLKDKTRIALLESYTKNFKKTMLIFQPLNGDTDDPQVMVKGTPIFASWPDGTSNSDGAGTVYTGWRMDCLGDLNFWKDDVPDWCHMYDVYPEDIIRSGMQDAWEKGHVSMEICGTFLNWRDVRGYGKEEVQYIFDQALKWHVSSFNAKSSAVPDEWTPLVDEWIKQMGYRFVLRKLTYPVEVRPNGQLPFTSWWENTGVAPIYKDYKLAFRLKNAERAEVIFSDCRIRGWMPGDNLYYDKVYIPAGMPTGEYQLQIAIVNELTKEPAIKLAIDGMQPDGWYPLGQITVREGNFPVSAVRVLDTP